MRIYKCLEESKDYLEDDLKNAGEFYFTDDEYQTFTDAIDAIQKRPAINSKVSKARLEPQYVNLEMPNAQDWKVDENLTDFIKITEVQQ